MSKQRRAKRKQTPQQQSVRWRLSRRQVASLALLVAVVALGFFARTSYSLWAKQMANSRLRSGAISEARHYLNRAAWSTPQDGTIDLMLAFCFRQSRQFDRWQDALKAAEKKGIPRELADREVRLYSIQAGDWPDDAESQLVALAGEGVTAYDVPAAFIAGCLANGRTALAQQIFSAWSTDCPNDAHVAYMRGKYWETLGDEQQAQKQYEMAIALESRHELAHAALATMLEGRGQLLPAYRLYAALGSASPRSEVAAIGAAKILRELGQLDRAKAILEPLAEMQSAEANESSPEVAVELGRVAMEQGNLPEAQRWFERAGIEDSWDPALLMSAVRLLGMQNNATEAERLFQRIAAVGNRVTRTGDLRIRLELDPNDTAAAAEIEQLRQELNAEMAAQKTTTEPASDAQQPGRQLFAVHCSACHGPQGDGNGRAARHLFPRPRDLRLERSRLVSTDNGVPTLNDTINVLRRGIPGTSMPAYDDLDEDDLRLLAEEVRRLRREGLRELYVNELEFFGDEVDEEDVRECVDLLSTPGNSIEVPPMGSPEPSSIARGKKIYLELACASCHGEDGAGLVEQIWHDERGFPVRTRDLGRELLKGGQDAESVYLRIAAGMPGTPHPSSSSLPQQSLIDVVQFCLSLSRGEPRKTLTDYQRAAVATSRAYLESLQAE